MSATMMEMVKQAARQDIGQTSLPAREYGGPEPLRSRIAMTAVALLLLLGAGFGSASAANALMPLDDQASAQDWLAHMARSVRELNYRGRSIVMNGDQLNSVEVIHGVFDGEPWERVIHLTGERAEILRRGDEVNCLHPNRLARFQTSSPSAPAPHKPLITSASFDAIVKYYQLNKAGVGRVAGRDVWRVDVTPKDRNRYGYQFWLDSMSGLMLKSVTVDQSGQGLEMFEFVDIQLDLSITKADFEPDDALPWQKKQSTPSASVINFPAWQVGWMPAGFVLTQHEMRRVGDIKASTKVYSDGLAAFSVFLEKVSPDTQAEGSRTHGATVALSRRMVEPASDYLVTVVGEIPMETAMQIAMGVSLK